MVYSHLDCDYDCKVANAQGFQSHFFYCALSKHCREFVIAKQNWKCEQTKTY